MTSDFQVQENDCARFEHDCERCIWLGRDGEYDVYACPQGASPSAWPTIVLRFGDDGPEYHSGAHLIDRLPAAMADRAQDHFHGWREED